MRLGLLATNAWVPLAEVARPHGVRGELRLRPFNRDSSLLLELDEVLLRLPNGEEQEVRVDASRRANDAILMKLFSIDDRDRADELRGSIVCARRASFPALGPGEFYACDIEGARVLVDAGDGDGEGAPAAPVGPAEIAFVAPPSGPTEIAFVAPPSGPNEGRPGNEHQAPRELGRVRALKTYPTADVLLVDTPDGGPSYEVPLVDSIVRTVDVERGLVVLSTMDGVERE